MIGSDAGTSVWLCSGGLVQMLKRVSLRLIIALLVDCLFATLHDSSARDTAGARGISGPIERSIHYENSARLIHKAKDSGSLITPQNEATSFFLSVRFFCCCCKFFFFLLSDLNG